MNYKIIKPAGSSLLDGVQFYELKKRTMTKENILQSALKEADPGKDSLPEILAAMDTYARQIATDFGPWLGRTYYYMKSKDKWYGWPGTNTPLGGYTIDDIFDLYQQQKQK